MIVIKIDLKIELNVNFEFFIIEINMKVMNFIKKEVIYKYHIKNNYNKNNNNKNNYNKNNYNNKKYYNYSDYYYSNFREMKKVKKKTDKFFLAKTFSDEKYRDFIFNYFRCNKGCFFFF